MLHDFISLGLHAIPVPDADPHVMGQRELGHRWGGPLKLLNWSILPQAQVVYQDREDMQVASHGSPPLIFGWPLDDRVEIMTVLFFCGCSDATLDSLVLRF